MLMMIITLIFLTIYVVVKLPPSQGSVFSHVASSDFLI